MFSLFLLVGALIGIAWYLITCFRHQLAPNATTAMEAGLCGAGVWSGVHLAFSAFVLDYLLHLTHGHRTVDRLFLFKTFEVDVSLGELHLLHILLGAAATAIISAVGLYKYCTELNHPADRPEPPPVATATRAKH